VVTTQNAPTVQPLFTQHSGEWGQQLHEKAGVQTAQGCDGLGGVTTPDGGCLGRQISRGG